MQSLIQIPDDSISVGYKQVKPFHFEQVFFSKSKSFTGTEHEFLANGLAYAYHQTSPFTRVTPCKA
jgi:hypothetical protein